MCACTHSVMLLCMGPLLYSTLAKNEIRDTIQPTGVIGMNKSRLIGSSWMTSFVTNGEQVCCHMGGTCNQTCWLAEAYINILLLLLLHRSLAGV